MNMFASVASGGRRRTNHGRTSLSPKRSRRKFSPDRSSYDLGSPSAVTEAALKQLDLEDFGDDGTSPSALDRAQGMLVPFTQDSRLQDIAAENDQKRKPKTMQDWIRHSRNPMPEEFFLAGCPGL